MEGATLHGYAAAKIVIAFTVGNGNAGVHIARALDIQQARYIVALFVSAANFQRVATICRAQVQLRSRLYGNRAVLTKCYGVPVANNGYRLRRGE